MSGENVAQNKMVAVGTCLYTYTFININVIKDAVKKDKAVMTIWNQWESFLILFLAIQIILGKMFYIKYQTEQRDRKEMNALLEG